jgi:levanbiose-producing levanase
MGQVFNDTHTAIIEEDREDIDIQLIMDRSTIEVFINEGEIVFSDLIFPKESKDTILSIITDSKKGKVCDLNINKLESVWS